MPSKPCWTTSAATLLLASLPALAQPALTSLGFDQTFGVIVGSEAICNLQFRPGSVEAAIAANVAPTDLEFAHWMGVYARTADDDFRRLTPAAQTAHCAAVTANARALGLID